MTERPPLATLAATAVTPAIRTGVVRNAPVIGAKLILSWIRPIAMPPCCLAMAAGGEDGALRSSDTVLRSGRLLLRALGGGFLLL